MNKKYAAIVALLFFAVGLAAQNAPGKYEMRAANPTAKNNNATIAAYFLFIIYIV